MRIPLVMLAGCSYVGTGDLGYYENSIEDISMMEEPDAPTEEYPAINPWVETEDEATSTFAIDVDTGSYSLARRQLVEGSLPDPSLIRVEEFLNYFDYQDLAPDLNAEHPFATHLEAAPSRFGDNSHLLRINLQTAEVAEADRDPANLVFLIDVSGSMLSDDRLGLVKYSLKQLVDRLLPTDTLSIVVYAGTESVLLEPTPVEDKSTILDALDALTVGGSTNGEAGISKAYELAYAAMQPNGINRVVLCTDGDFNVGLSGEALIDLIELYKSRGVYLTTLGFGMGNYQDETLEQLADHGDGNYAYIDSRSEAMRVIGENLVSTLQVVAKDVKVQVEFEPEQVTRWRLIGYENRVLANEDFVDDTVDGGEIGAGHAVTALYELELTEQAVDNPERLAEVRLRYKQPNGTVSIPFDTEFIGASILPSFEEASPAFRFGAAVSEFAEILRHSEHSEGARFTDITDITETALEEPSTIETEFLDLVATAEDLWP